MITCFGSMCFLFFLVAEKVLFIASMGKLTHNHDNMRSLGHYIPIQSIPTEMKWSFLGVNPFHGTGLCGYACASKSSSLTQRDSKGNVTYSLQTSA